jgi:type IV pilus assembly protein PilC
MTLYQYTIHSPDDNQVITSTCVAESPELIRARLKRIGYHIDTLKPHTRYRRAEQHKRVRRKDLVNFCRRFAVMYSAGLPLMDCLNSLALENDSSDLNAAITKVQKDIRAGTTVADAFGRHPRIFSSLFVNMLRAGETAGKFDYVLTELAGYIEREAELRRKIVQALAYPLTVFAMILVVTSAIMLLVVPVFAKIYSQMDLALPGPTVTLMFLSQYAPLWISGLVIVVVGWVVTLRILGPDSPLRVAWDRLLLSIPLIGKVIRDVILLRFIRTLAIMIKAGIPLDESIGLARNVAQNAAVNEASHMMQQSIRRGGAIADAARLHDFFPPMIVQAFVAGEEAGKLDEMLERFAEGLKQDVDDGVKSLVAKIEPMLIVVLSAIVGFILLAIYLPMFDLMKGLKA